MARRIFATVAAVGVALISALSFATPHAGAATPHAGAATPHAGAAPAGSAPSLGADVPITGDWDGNGTTTIGVMRPSGFLLRNTNGAGAVNVAASFGLPADVAITGDCDGDDTTTIGVFREGTWFLRNTNSSGGVDASFPWGLSPTPNPQGRALALALDGAMARWRGGLWRCVRCRVVPIRLLNGSHDLYQRSRPREGRSGGRRCSDSRGPIARHRRRRTSLARSDHPGGATPSRS